MSRIQIVKRPPHKTMYSVYLKREILEKAGINPELDEVDIDTNKKGLITIRAL